jgi:hypothetical protein
MRGTTDAPIIAERTLSCAQDGRPLTVRVHAPERLAEEDWRALDDGFDFPWGCGFVLLGIPELRRFVATAGDVTDDEVWFDVGRDSYEALANAMGSVRSLLDRASQELGLEFTWPAALDSAESGEAPWHEVPALLPRWLGRDGDTRLNDVLLREQTAIVQERVQARRAAREDIPRSAEGN